MPHQQAFVQQLVGQQHPGLDHLAEQAVRQILEAAGLVDTGHAALFRSYTSPAMGRHLPGPAARPLMLARQIETGRMQKDQRRQRRIAFPRRRSGACPRPGCRQPVRFLQQVQRGMHPEGPPHHLGVGQRGLGRQFQRGLRLLERLGLDRFDAMAGQRQKPGAPCRMAQDRLGHDQRKAQPRVQHQGLAADGTGNSQRLRHAAKGPSPERVQQRLPRRKKPLQHAGQRPGQGDMPLGESIAQAHGSRAERAGFAGDDQPRFTHASKSSCRILDSAPGSPWSSP